MSKARRQTSSVQQSTEPRTCVSPPTTSTTTGTSGATRSAPQTPTLSAFANATGCSEDTANGLMPGGKKTSGASQPSGQPVAGGKGKSARSAKFDASKADVATLTRLLAKPSVGNLSVSFSIGIAAQLLKIVQVSADVQLGLDVAFDDDRRVRVQASLALVFKGEVDLYLWKKSAKVERSWSKGLVFRSPEHLATWVNGVARRYQEACEAYVRKKGGKANGPVVGQAVPQAKGDADPTLEISKSTTSINVKVERGKLLKKYPWMASAGGTKRWVHFTATRKNKQTGMLEELDGTVVHGIVEVSTPLGTVQVDYNVTENHPNPDQEGVFVDFRYSTPAANVALGKGVSEAQLKAGAAALASFKPGKNPVASAKNWLKTLLDAAKKTSVPNDKAAGGLAPHGMSVHMQLNGASDDFTVRFVRVLKTASATVKGQVPITPTVALTSSLQMNGAAQVFEIIGTGNLLYVRNVYNGLIKRKTFHEEWAAWTRSNASSLWSIFQNIAAGKTRAAADADGPLTAACGMAKKALGSSTPHPATLAALTTALERYMGSMNNEATGWSSNGGYGGGAWDAPAKPKPKPKIAKVHISGAQNTKAVFSSVELNTKLPVKPKTLRDVHDAGFLLEVSAPGIKSRRRGGLFFKGKKPTFKKDLVTGLQLVWPDPIREFDPSGLFVRLVPSSVPGNANDMQQFAPVADSILDGLLKDSALQMPS